MRVYDYSAQELLVLDDRNYPEYSGHPRMPGLVYVDKHVQVIANALPSRRMICAQRLNSSCSQARTLA
jgi:hypothetical protein